MYVLVMRSGSRLLSSDGPETRLGRLVLAGEVVDDEPVMPSSLRVMDDYVLSVVFAGRGTYRDEDGAEQPIGPGAVTAECLPAIVDRLTSAAQRATTLR